MQVCNYCGRNFKNEYETCPGCGSTSFHRITTNDEMVIKTPPKGGYKVNLKNFEGRKKVSNVIKVVGFIFIIIIALFMLPFLGVGFLTMDVDRGFSLMWILTIISAFSIFVGVGIFLVIISKKSYKKTQDEMAKVENLSKNGILYKNIPYELVNTGYVMNGKTIYSMKIMYENKSGKKIPLVSDPKYNYNFSRNDSGRADLLIDPKDESNYYIDLEIY